MKSPQKKYNTRLLALDIVYKTMTGEEFIDKVIDDMYLTHPGLESREKSFITRLSKGCVERIIELDYLINELTDNSETRIKPVVRDILRLGLYQILYMDSVPDSAAVNESVKLLEIKKVSALKGFVNAILRNAIRKMDDIPYPSKKKDEVKYYSVWYSCPEWIVKYLLENYGEETEKILQSFFNDDNFISVRMLRSKAPKEDIIKSLENQVSEVRKGVLFDYALRLYKTSDLRELDAFNKGYIQVQDESSMITGAVADAKDGMNVLDICAAPGGKSIHMADDMRYDYFKKQASSENGVENVDADGRVDEGNGCITACDKDKKKVSLIRDNLKRLNIHNIKLKKNDALEYNPEFEKSFDLIVADLPCTGLGVLSKKCDIKYKTKYKDIKALQTIQRKILINCCKYLKPGAMLVYSTCTITKEENIDNVDWIKEKLKLRPVSIEDKLPNQLKGKTGEEGYIQVLPSVAGTDGFFVAAFKKD